MKIYNLLWWILILLNFMGYLVFRFGMISRGAKNYIIEFLGGVLISLSFILMFIFPGIKSGLILIPIFWFIVTPIVEFFIKKIEKTLYKEQLRTEKIIAQKRDISVKELRKQKNETPEKIMKNFLDMVNENAEN